MHRRRVVVIGDATSSLPELLLARGARLVRVYDANHSRLRQGAARGTTSQVSFSPLRVSSLGEGAFDVAIVEDLNALGDFRQLITALADGMGPHAAALVAIPNPAAARHLLPVSPPLEKMVDYYELYDAMSEEFEFVRMLGQSPFVGYSVFEFSTEGEPEPVLDPGYLPGGAEEPEWFVALGSPQAIDLESYTVVQMPLEDVFSRQNTLVASAEMERLAASEREARQEIERLRQRANRAKREPEAAARRLAALEEQLRERDTWIAELEARAAAADARADAVEEKLATADEQAAKAASLSEKGTEARVQKLSDELVETHNIINLLKAEIDDARLAAKTARADAEKARASSDATEEYLKLEKQLINRGAEVRRLQHELRELERFARELVHDVLDGRSAPDSDQPALNQLRAKLDKLSKEDAVRQADLEAARWTIASLERRLRTPTTAD